MRKGFHSMSFPNPFDPIRDRLRDTMGGGDHADAAALLWRARAEASVAIWNRENPDDPTTIDAWAARYPVEIVSERSTDSHSGARALSQFVGARARNT